MDASSIPRAEDVVETLSDTLGSFAPTAIQTERSPQMAMAAWLMRGEAPARFSIDDDLELQTSDKTKAIIRYTRHPLDGKEIRAHLNAGKYPTRLGLTWNGRVSFVLTDKVQVKRLEFLELGSESTDGEEVDPASYYFRINPVFEAPTGKYEWLNRVLAIGTGHRFASGPVYSVFEVL